MDNKQFRKWLKSERVKKKKVERKLLQKILHPNKGMFRIPDNF